MKEKRNYRWQDMDKSGTDLSILIRQYEVQNRTEGKSGKTVSWYNELLGLFYKWLKSQELPTTLEFMNEDVVRLFILDLQERPGLRGPKMSTHSVANRVGGLRTFFGWLSRRGYTQGHLLEELRLPKKAELVIEPLSPEEINQIFSMMNPNTALGARNTALVSLMLDSGLRVSEEAGIKEENLHLDSRYVKVMGKGSKERMISFGLSCQRALLQYYHYLRPDPAHSGVDTFFLSIDGYPMTTSSIQSMMKRLAKSSGVPRMYPHLFRHTYATMFLLNGGDVFLLQQNLGHTSLEIVRRYVHLASRMAAVRSQSFSPLDRLNVKEGRRYKHSFNRENGTRAPVYPDSGVKRNPKQGRTSHSTSKI
jgi:integrase/recombinase XerC/integrase/recombinase XerD